MSFTKEWLKEQIRNNPELKIVTGVRSASDEPKAVKAKGKRPHKYSAERTEVGGIVFDSKKEAKRYIQLKALEDAGGIENLELQPVFLLQEGFTDDEGKRHRKIEYHADFSYWVDGDRIVEDTKGMKTAVFRLKWKMLLFRYKGQGIRFIVT